MIWAQWLYVRGVSYPWWLFLIIIKEQCSEEQLLHVTATRWQPSVLWGLFTIFSCLGQKTCLDVVYVQLGHSHLLFQPEISCVARPAECQNAFNRASSSFLGVFMMPPSQACPLLDLCQPLLRHPQQPSQSAMDILPCVGLVPLPVHCHALIDQVFLFRY